MVRPVKSQFQGVRESAANLGQGRGSYTSEMFQEDFPQFFTKGTEEVPAAPLLPPRNSGGVYPPGKRRHSAR